MSSFVLTKNIIASMSIEMITLCPRLYSSERFFLLIKCFCSWTSLYSCSSLSYESTSSILTFMEFTAASDFPLFKFFETSFLQTPWREVGEDPNWARTEFSTGGLYQRGI